MAVIRLSVTRAGGGAWSAAALYQPLIPRQSDLLPLVATPSLPPCHKSLRRPLVPDNIQQCTSASPPLPSVTQLRLRQTGPSLQLRILGSIGRIAQHHRGFVLVPASQRPCTRPIPGCRFHPSAFFYWNTPTFTLACTIHLNTDSKPPFRPFRILYVPKHSGIHHPSLPSTYCTVLWNIPSQRSRIFSTRPPQPPSALLPISRPPPIVPLSPPLRPPSCQTRTTSFSHLSPLTPVPSPQNHCTM